MERTARERSIVAPYLGRRDDGLRVYRARGGTGKGDAAKPQERDPPVYTDFATAADMVSWKPRRSPELAFRGMIGGDYSHPSPGKIARCRRRDNRRSRFRRSTPRSMLRPCRTRGPGRR